MLSDRDGYSSPVAEGPLRGRTITQLMERSPQLLIGSLSRRFKRFPLLLKFLDVQKMLSVRVHPSDDDTNLIPDGRIIYRSPEPVLVPEGLLGLHGAIDNVVFPTGVNRRDDLGTPDRFDVYYGMADDRIGVARLDVPATLPLEHSASLS